ncbi:hypothetical protein BJX76DRAFT_361249 [Aspergillus varians]
MSSYFSSITSSSAISNIGTRLNSFRRAITSDEADDPDNEDCSHISNVLRTYYIEKGRHFPAWLPPDPKERTNAPTRVIATSNAAASSGSVSSGRGGGLGDLWGDAGGAAAAPPSQTASLRRGRGHPGTSQTSLPTQTSPTHSPSPSLQPPGGRPLPSQRNNSYQSITSSSSSPGLERAPSAQERLRARLQGGRSPSPGQLSDPSVRKPVGASQGSGRFR